MRTEKEVRARIEQLEDFMRIAITKYYTGEYDVRADFEQIYSGIWDEMRHLHWVLGYENKAATKIVAQKVVTVSDEIKRLIFTEA